MDVSSNPFAFDPVAAWHAVRARVAAAALAAGRDPHSVALLAVSKTFNAQAVWPVVQAGQAALGENYVQEGVEKIQALRALQANVAWHCIGPIQSNKAKLVAEHFDWVQSIDRLKIAQRLSQGRAATQPPLQVCIQVNVDAGPTKSGVAWAQATALAESVHQLPGLQLRGLMCIPDPQPTAQARRANFARAAELFAQWQQRGWPVDTLSMGMSEDLEDAIACGATMVRVGSAIFGRRAAAPPVR